MAYPSFKDFNLEPNLSNNRFNRLNFQDQSSPLDHAFGPHQMSDGSLRFCCLATLLLLPPDLIPKVIAIDEPELGLHPAAIELLAGMMYTASENAQVVVATQSPLLLDNFEPRHIRVIEREGASSYVREMDEESLHNWLETYTLGEVFQKNLVGGRP